MATSYACGLRRIWIGIAETVGVDACRARVDGGAAAGCSGGMEPEAGGTGCLRMIAENRRAATVRQSLAGGRLGIYSVVQSKLADPSSAPVMDAQTQAREDLAAIRHLMQDGQQVVNAAGPHFVVWGILSAAALAATYVLGDRGDARTAWWVWGVAISLGWIASIALTYRGVRQARVTTATGRLLRGLWLGTGVTLTLLGFVAPAGGGLDVAAITGVLAAVLGGASFATGMLVSSRWLQAAGGGWWAGALFMLLWPGSHGLLITAGLVIVLQTIPGLVLMARARRGLAIA